MDLPQPLPPRPQRATPEASEKQPTAGNPTMMPLPLSRPPVAPERQAELAEPAVSLDHAVSQIRSSQEVLAEISTYLPEQLKPFEFHKGFLLKWVKKTSLMFSILLPVILIFATLESGFELASVIITALFIMFCYGLVVLITWIMTKTFNAPVIVDINSQMITLRGITKPISEIKYARFSIASSRAGISTTLEFGYDAKVRTYIVLQNNVMTSTIEEVEFLRYIIPLTSIPVISNEPKKSFGGFKVLLGRTDMDSILNDWSQAQQAHQAQQAEKIKNKNSK